MANLKVFRMNEYETVVALSAKQAYKWYQMEFNMSDEEIEISEITENEDVKVWWQFYDINELELRIDKFGQLTVGRWGGDLATLLTIKQALELYDGQVPHIFSTTEC